MALGGYFEAHRPTVPAKRARFFSSSKINVRRINSHNVGIRRLPAFLIVANWWGVIASGHGDGQEDLFLAALPNGVEPQHYATARADMICRASMRVCGGYRDRSLEAIADKHLSAFRESRQTGRRKAGGEATIEDYVIEAEQACLADLDKADAERAKRSASRRRSRKKKRNKRRKGSGRKRKRKQKRKSSS